MNVEGQTWQELALAHERSIRRTREAVVALCTHLNQPEQPAGKCNYLNCPQWQELANAVGLFSEQLGAHIADKATHR